jgi:hypothetical protein|tara:strand:+ start:63 stop:425 length:363 start_codon:yes stop_codon:yes gene_type:complete
MGNRASIAVTAETGASDVFIYLHWNGSPQQVVDAVEDAAPVMRESDADYAIARLIGTIHARIEGGLSLGVAAATEVSRNADDNGHYIVDMSAGTITQEIEGRDGTWSGAIIAEGIEFGSF